MELNIIQKIVVTFLCITLGSTLYADEESKPFIGLEVGYATVQGDVGGFFPGEPLADYQGSDVEYGLRIGLQNNQWRTTIVYNYFDSTKDDHAQNYEKGLLEIDYFLMTGKDNPFKPHIGVNLGYVNYESTDNIDLTGFVYGAQAGFIYDITKNVSIDLMYRYSLSNAGQDNRDTSLDHIGAVVFGLNYAY